MLFAFNQGEVCTCPSRALIHESIYDAFMERVLKRIAAIKHGNPLDTDTMMGAQASKQLSWIKILPTRSGQAAEGAEVLIGGEQPAGGRSDGGYLHPADPVQGPQQDAHLPGRSSARCWP